MSQSYTKGIPISTDPTMSANSDQVVPSQAAIVSYVNSVLGTGGVASVNASAPVVSSGGINPTISIPQASATQDGYLSAADFVAFSTGGGTYSVYSIDYDSDITGARDGVNETYNTSASFITGSLKVWLNGVLLTPGASNDYIVINSNTFEMNYAPLVTDVFVAEYLISSARPVPSGFDPQLTFAYLAAY